MFKGPGFCVHSPISRIDKEGWRLEKTQRIYQKTCSIAEATLLQLSYTGERYLWEQKSRIELLLRIKV
ncbi:Hypothetical protein Minf_1543 [Methylacidiphilum infernorum V4]|uniref:Uncharacterized protein n=1 Tax=Methylacidiphilum infernorum (isolate V4) TaxID=481448 RepID=B3DW94_METI4|nr:Hypothetical protein Minf_1543 [Methylacidiphilum infernorum V4]